MLSASSDVARQHGNSFRTTVANSAAAQEYFARAEQLFNSGSYLEATRYYRRAWELDPALDRAVLYIGDCCFRLGLLFIAFQFFWEALLRNPKDYLGWMLTGDAYLKLGRPELAGPYFTRALDLNPTNPRLRQTVQSLPELASSLQRYFEEQLVPENRWTIPLDTQRTSAFRRDFLNASETSATAVCFFYREYLNPRRFEKLENAFGRFIHDSRFAQARESHPDIFQAEAKEWRTFLERLRLKIASSEKHAGPPRRYRFDAADGALLLKRVAARKKINERKKLIEDTSYRNEDADLKRLRSEGFKLLEAFLEKLKSNEPANSLIENFTFALSDALAGRDFEKAQALALGEMELTMCFAQPGLAESETLPSGEGISEGAEKVNPDPMLEAIKFIETAATPEEAVREVQARAWHVETILYAFSMMGPQMYVLYAADYSKAYDLSKKIVLLSDLLPQRLRRFPLRAFYRAQGLASLAEAAAKLGLHEETIRAGAALEATIEEMGTDWDNDLPEYPATMMRLGQAQLPERLLERTYNLMAGAYRALSNSEQATATSGKISQIASTLLVRRGYLASRDCLALMEELRTGANDKLDSAFKYAYMALALDERKYREAGVQFHGNRVLAEMVGELGLPRLETIHRLRAFAAAVEMNIPFNILFCLYSLGSVLEQNKDMAGAEYFYRKALRRIEAQSFLEGSMVTTRPAIGSLFRLAVLIRHRAPEEARSLLERAIGVVETQREAIREDLNAAGFGQAGSDIYAELIDLNLDILKDSKQAFVILERSKIRALLDQFERRASSEQQAHPPARFEDICSALLAP
jgi:tetratricopeptide (TPR) repeat protein